MTSAFDNPDFFLSAKGFINAFGMSRLDQFVSRAMHEKHWTPDRARERYRCNTFYIKSAAIIRKLLTGPKDWTQNGVRQVGRPMSVILRNSSQGRERAVSPHCAYPGVVSSNLKCNGCAH